MRYVLHGYRRSVEWARRRYQMGLAGMGYPWEEGEEAWGMLRNVPHVLDAMSNSGDFGAWGPGDGASAMADLPPEVLADDDSKFMEVAGIKVSGIRADMLKKGKLYSRLVGTPRLTMALSNGLGLLYFWEHILLWQLHGTSMPVIMFAPPMRCG